MYITKLDKSSLGINRALSTCCTSISEKASQIPISWAKEIDQTTQNAVASAIPNKKAPLEHIAVDDISFVIKSIHTQPYAFQKILHYNNSNPRRIWILGEAHRQDREMWKKLSFVLINFEEGCFSLLNLFHLSKKHVFITFSRIPSNITSKVTLGCNVW